jgi:hypothetical protein
MATGNLDENCVVVVEKLQLEGDEVAAGLTL